MQNGLTERILKLFFDDDRPQRSKIVLIKIEFEDQGLSKKWVNFILDSFCSDLGWEIENKDDDNDKSIKNKVTENNFTVNKEIDFEETKRQLELAQKQFKQAQKSKIDDAYLKTQEAEKNFEETEHKSKLTSCAS